MDLSFDWVPGQSIGPFLFGHTIGALVEEYGLETVPEEFDEDVGWRVLALIGNRDEMRVYADEGKVSCVACYRNCWYKGVNLIGTEFVEVMRLIGGKPLEKVETYEIQDVLQKVFEFDEIDAQVWVEAEKVVAMICGSPSEDQSQG